MNYGLVRNVGLFGQANKKKRQPVSKNQKNTVKIKQKGRCKDCRKVLVVEEYHHIKQVCKNGKSVTGNLVALCPNCHRKRHIKEASKKTDKKRVQTKQDYGVLGFNPKPVRF